MTRSTDPLQLPETAGPTTPQPMIDLSTATWLGWVAATIAVDLVVTLAVGLIYPHLEVSFLVFGLGIFWAALTPRVIRRIGRWVRG